MWGMENPGGILSLLPSWLPYLMRYRSIRHSLAGKTESGNLHVFFPKIERLLEYGLMRR